MAEIDQIVSRPARTAAADAIEAAIARGEQAGAEVENPGLIDESSTAKVVPIGHGQFGVIWDGRLRWEKYPNKLFAHLAVAALRRTRSQAPSRPVRLSVPPTSLAAAPPIRKA
jgi:hypothetical protein